MSANRQVTFQTDFFKRVHGEEEETNPGRYGKALAQWLAENLRERDVAVEDVLHEDFGWVVMVSRKPYVLWLGCGNTDGSTTEWNVFPVVEFSIMQRLFKNKNPTQEIEKLVAHLTELVPSIPNVTNIVWE